jgi:hypothetical protein
MYYARVLLPAAAAVAALFLRGADAAQEQEEPCSVCGPGLQVGSPDVFVELLSLETSLPAMFCGQLEAAGEIGLLSTEQCLELPNLIVSSCNCQEQDAAAAAAPSSSSVAPPPSSTTTTPCSVCGPGMRVGDPDAVFEFPDQEPAAAVMMMMPCQLLQEAGDYNWLPPEENCSTFWPDQIFEICACQEEAETPIPPPSLDCKACPEGYKVANPEVTVGTVENVLCGDLDNNEEGIYITDTCNLLSFVVDMSCGGCVLVANDDVDDESQAQSPMEDTPAVRRGYNNGTLFERGYSLYIVIAAGCFLVLILGCLLYSKYLGDDGPVGPSNFTPGLTAAIAHANAEALEKAKFEEEAKLRPLVLNALFPEQKVRELLFVCRVTCDVYVNTFMRVPIFC